MTRFRSLAVALTMAAAATIALSLPDPAAACTVCFGDPESAETRGLRGAILFLLVLVGLVQVGFVRLFWEFRRRSKAIEDRKKQLRVLRGGVRS